MKIPWFKMKTPWFEKMDEQTLTNRVTHGFVAFVDGFLSLILNPFGIHSNIYFKYTMMKAK